MGHRANCGNTRLPPVHDDPVRGCNRWTYNPGADLGVRSVVDWHVKSAHNIPGFEPPDPLRRFRAPLSGADIHRLHYANPSPATAALAWELARERWMLCNIRNSVIAIAKLPKTPLRTQVYLLRLGAAMLSEPGVAEDVERQNNRDRMVHRGS